jgi:class 3 adenylate cyclase
VTQASLVETAAEAVGTDRLRPFVPRLAVEWLETTPEARVREIDGSMVFVDISGFTKMSERLARRGKVGAEEVTEVIGDTFGTLLAEAYAFGGSLVKFGGDALLLFFEGDDHPARAAAAAHGMRAMLRQIGTFTTTAGKVTLRMSVGAHTGAFHFFLVGDSHRELIVAGPAATETVAMREPPPPVRSSSARRLQPRCRGATAAARSGPGSCSRDQPRRSSDPRHRRSPPTSISRRSFLGRSARPCPRRSSPSTGR